MTREKFIEFEDIRKGDRIRVTFNNGTVYEGIAAFGPWDSVPREKVYDDRYRVLVNKWDRYGRTIELLARRVEFKPGDIVRVSADAKQASGERAFFGASIIGEVVVGTNAAGDAIVKQIHPGNSVDPDWAGYGDRQWVESKYLTKIGIATEDGSNDE